MRKFSAMLMLLAYLAFCIFFFATLGTWISDWHRALQLIFFIVAGFIWIAPLKALFAWMNSGTSSEDT